MAEALRQLRGKGLRGGLVGPQALPRH
jgi:hypothetical protein